MRIGQSIKNMVGHSERLSAWYCWLPAWRPWVCTLLLAVFFFGSSNLSHNQNVCWVNSPVIVPLTKILIYIWNWSPSAPLQLPSAPYTCIMGFIAKDENMFLDNSALNILMSLLINTKIYQTVIIILKYTYIKTRIQTVYLVSCFWSYIVVVRNISVCKRLSHAF